MIYGIPHVDDSTHAGLPFDHHSGQLVFCAKESFYKCYFPLARRRLGFADAEIVFDPAARSFEARLLREDAPGALGARLLRGRYRIDATHVVTAVMLTGSECDAPGHL